jgi:hypothetical protein
MWLTQQEVQLEQQRGQGHCTRTRGEDRSDSEDTTELPRRCQHKRLNSQELVHCTACERKLHSGYPQWLPSSIGGHLSY